MVAQGADRGLQLLHCYLCVLCFIYSALPLHPQEATAITLAARLGNIDMHLADLGGKVAAAQQQAGTAVHIATKARHTADVCKAQQKGRDRRGEHQQEAGADVPRRRAPRAAAALQVGALHWGLLCSGFAA